MNTNFSQGDKVVLKGSLTLYEKWGQYQLIVTSIKKEGIGNLFLAFEELKKKLEREGLFDKEKKALPFPPKKLAILTSKDGAALDDFLNIAEKRYPFLQVVIIPTIVQGEKSAPDIVNNIDYVKKYLKDVDLIVLTRGGGSIEDLWSFNEEIVARAIDECPIPIVSAIGHQRDYSIADFVADKYFATPSEAAEKIYPDYNNLLQKLKMIEGKIKSSFQNVILNKEMQLMKQKELLKKKSLNIYELKEEVNFYKTKLIDLMNINLNEKIEAFQNYKSILQKNDPSKKLLENKHEIEIIKNTLKNLMEKTLSDKKQEIELIKSKLELVSPFNLLQKGYALIKNDKNQAISSVDNLKIGDNIKILLKDGEKIAQIKE